MRLSIVWSLLWTAAAFNSAESMCAQIPDLNQTVEVSKILSTPPTRQNVTTYFNPCHPVQVPGCADDDHLCSVEYTEVDGKFVLTAIKPYGSASNGAEGFFYEAPDTIYASYQEAKWGDQDLYDGVEIQCGTTVSFELGGSENRFGPELVLKTPAVCGLAPVIHHYHDGWSALQIVSLITLIAIVALFTGVLFLWMFLRFAQRRGDLTAEFGLGDALYDIVSGMVFNIGSFLSRFRR